MSTYMAYWTGEGSSTTYQKNLYLKANTNPLKIVSVTAYGGSPSGWTDVVWNLSRFTGSSPTGGTTLTPFSLRDGAPATTATSRYSITGITGTESVIVSSFASGDLVVYTPPFELTIAPGNALFYGTTSGSGNIYIIEIVYEELRVPGSY